MKEIRIKDQFSNKNPIILFILGGKTHFRNSKEMFIFSMNLIIHTFVFVSVSTISNIVKLNYKELGYNKDLVITNKVNLIGWFQSDQFLSLNGSITALRFEKNVSSMGQTLN